MCLTCSVFSMWCNSSTGLSGASALQPSRCSVLDRLFGDRPAESALPPPWP